jgi:putative Mn2+ efflux pump MntP
MEMLGTLVLAVGLGMDAMSVCMAVGVRWHGRRQRFRLAWHMGLFQFLMPILGWLAGRQLATLLRSIGSYAAAGLLFAIGAKMLLEAIKSHPGAVAEGAVHLVERELHVRPRDPTRGWALIGLAVATSIDALVVGFSLGISAGEHIILRSAIIGVVAASMSLLGVAIGKRLGSAFGKLAEILGALLLMGLGVSFLWI